MFEKWLSQHHIQVNGNYHNLYKNWLSNDQYIQEINNLNLTYKLAHNAYSGYSIEEFATIMGFSRPHLRTPRQLLQEDAEEMIHANGENESIEQALPTQVDWRTKGVVNPIKDQGQCGSCWAFSTIASLESAVAIKTGTLYSLSEQELVDCDTLLNNGCNGGLMDAAFSWIGRVNGVCTEVDYPYVSGTTKKAGSCKSSACKAVSASDVISYVDVTPNSDDAMMTALAKQPVSVAVEADQRDFQLYSSGVFTAACGTNLDHGVVLVGYGQDYYILRNSWGVSWGDQGYMYLGKGSSYGPSGQCGVLSEGSYPVV